MQGCSQPRQRWLCVDFGEVSDGPVRGGDEVAAAGLPRSAPCLQQCPHRFPVTPCGLNGVSMLWLLFHPLAGHSPLEPRLLGPLAAGVAAGDQAGSSEAEWM